MRVTSPSWPSSSARQFHRDVVIDLYCYRRHGHNEGDEPAFTQPLMYSKIKRPADVSAEIYTEAAHRRRRPDASRRARRSRRKFQDKLDQAQEEVQERPAAADGGMHGFSGHWEGLQPKYIARPGRDRRAARHAASGSPTRLTTRARRVRRSTRRSPSCSRPPADAVDAGKAGSTGRSAESLAFGSLLLEGTRVRLTRPGQPARHVQPAARDAVRHPNTGERLRPAQADSAKPPGCFAIYDSLLSEAAVLGFEFGFSLDCPDTLVLWEAQFGDFANGAQVIIDQFIACSGAKWQRDSGLVHAPAARLRGPGAGALERPGSSASCRCAPRTTSRSATSTTPAQYFHVLRRQMKRDFRKPLVLMTPKSLLRHKDAVSPVDEFASGRFQRGARRRGRRDPTRVRRVLLCSGKVYYDLLEKREQDEATTSPSSASNSSTRSRKPICAGRSPATGKAREWVWVQEESQNMGGVVLHGAAAAGAGVRRRSYVGRDASAAGASGRCKIHQKEQAELVEAALNGGPVPYVVGARRHPAEKVKPAWSGSRRSKGNPSPGPSPEAGGVEDARSVSGPVPPPALGEGVRGGVRELTTEQPLRHAHRHQGPVRRRVGHRGPHRPLAEAGRATVQRDDMVCELETDKATAEVPAPAAGVLRHAAREGDTVSIGAVIGSIDPAGAPAAAPARAAGNGPAPPRPAEAPRPSLRRRSSRS